MYIISKISYINTKSLGGMYIINTGPMNIKIDGGGAGDEEWGGG